MIFYTQQHKYYCGIDLHARKMYVCIVDQKGKVMVHENINSTCASASLCSKTSLSVKFVLSNLCNQ